MGVVIDRANFAFGSVLPLTAAGAVAAMGQRTVIRVTGAQSSSQDAGPARLPFTARLVNIQCRAPNQQHDALGLLARRSDHVKTENGLGPVRDAGLDRSAFQLALRGSRSAVNPLSGEPACSLSPGRTDAPYDRPHSFLRSDHDPASSKRW